MLRQSIMRYNWNQETDYVEDGKAKPYQVREFLQLVEKYDLELGD